MDETQERILDALAARRKDVDRRKAFFRQEILEAAAAGIGPSAIARASGYTREHIARIIRNARGPKDA